MTLNMLEAVRAEAPSAPCCSPPRARSTARRARPDAEDELLRPPNPYAVSKAACDLLGGLYADAHGLRVIRARAFNHSGPGQEPLRDRVVRGRSRWAAPVRVVTGNPDTRRDYTDVRDVVRAYRMLAARGEPGIFNVCSGRSRSPASSCARSASSPRSIPGWCARTR